MARLLGLCGALGKDRSAQPAMRRREAIIRPMWIMVAGPWGLGTRSEEEKAANLRRMNEAALEVFNLEHVPIIGVNAALPLLLEAPIERHREIMMGVSLALAERCDAILRLPGESSGADEEVAVLRAAGKPVWYSISEIPAG